MLLAAAACGVPFGSAREASAAAPPAAEAGRELDLLLRQLGDDSFRVREDATRELWELGDAALPGLSEAASRTEEPERMIRSRDLLRKIQLHITPETDPAVANLVERYLRAGVAEKAAMFGKLKARRAWLQMLKLFANESRPDLREKLLPSLEGVAVRAAREQLAKANPARAREFLELAPVNPDSLIALAVWHRGHGTLEAELERANAIQGEARNHSWLVALHRAAGNPRAAAEAATAAGNPRLAALLTALAGDPLPWLAMAHEKDDEVATIYSKLAAKRWRGAALTTKDLEPLVRMTKLRDRSERGSALNALFLLARPQDAEAGYARHDPSLAFAYFEALERVPEALDVLGIDSAEPDFPAWIAKRFSSIVKPDIEDQHEPSRETDEWLLIASFLDRRGLDREADAAFFQPLIELSAINENRFLDLLAELFGGRSQVSGAPSLARRVGGEWAADSEDRWREVLISALGDDDATTDWWEWLGEIDPKLGPDERFDVLMAVFRQGSDPRGLRRKWLPEFIGAMDGAARDHRRVALAERLSAFGIDTKDATITLAAWKHLPETAVNEIFWGARITHFSAAERWNDVAEAVLGAITAQAESRDGLATDVHAHAYAAAALRLAGREDEAAIHDQWAETLYLGDPSFAIRIGNGYAFGRDYHRAAIWWQRAALEADENASEFLLALKMHADSLLEQGRWLEAAATSELLTRAYASPEYRWNFPLSFMRQRLNSDLARGLSMVETNRADAIRVLGEIHRVFLSDGSLADEFFPLLRRVGLVREHDQWFEATWKFMGEAIGRYPDSDNTRNSAAWFASRAVRRLDEAAEHITAALARRPDQPAYLDTMAEVEFARGRRAEAVKWSNRAIQLDPDDSQIRRQHLHFLFDPLPN